jgi:hypothetical protein
MCKITKNIIKMPFYLTVGYVAIILTAFVGIKEMIKK